MIFIIEKEFHVGMIDDDYPYMKFLNLCDEDNATRYKKTFDKGIDKDEIKTLG